MKKENYNQHFGITLHELWPSKRQVKQVYTFVAEALHGKLETFVINTQLISC